MAFPTDPLDLRAYLWYSSGWNQITADVFDRGVGVQVDWGQADEAPQLEAMTCKAELNNGASNVAAGVSGRYSDNNPRSDLYGLLGRNTPFKIEIGEPHVGATNVSLSDVTDHVAPSVESPTDDAMLLCAWAAPNPAGTYTLPGSMTASGSTTDARTSMDSAFESIGAAGATGTRTATFSAVEDYLAASVLLHGSPTIDTSGGFSTVISDAGAEAGDWWVVISYFGWDVDGTRTPYFPRDTDGGGWILLADTGTANPGDTEAQFFRMKAWGKRVKVDGDHTIWVDNPGELDSIQSVMWRVSGVTAWSPQFHGEVAEWPARWDVSGFDRWVPIEAAGRVRRDGRVQTVIASAPRRYIPTTSPWAYWSLTDAEDVSQGQPVTGGAPLKPVRSIGATPLTQPRWGQGTMAPHLEPCLRVGVASELGITAIDASTTADSQTWTVDVMYRYETGASGTNIRLYDDDLTIAVDIFLDQTPVTGSEYIIVRFFDLPGSSTVSKTTSDSQVPYDGKAHHVRLEVAESGADSTYALYVDGVEVISGTATGAQVIPQNVLIRGFLNIIQQGAEAFADLSHLAVWDGSAAPLLATAVSAAFGWQGEMPSERIDRVLHEEDIAHAIVGDSDKQEVLLGPQYPGKLLEILGEAARTGGGWLYEPREFRGYAYRTIGSAYNRTAAIGLDYDGPGEIAPPLNPTRDDQRTANDITIQRRSGATVRKVQESGPLNVNDPADDDQGVGRYDTSVTVNVAGDGSLLDNQAGWRLHLGTVDEARYPEIALDLAAMAQAGKTTLMEAAAALGVADRLTIANPPEWLPPELVDQLVLGGSALFGQFDWDVTLNCTPYEPYRIAEVGHVDFSIIGAFESTTADPNIGSGEFEAGTDTVLTVTGSWVHEVDYDIFVAGVRLTVTAASGPLLAPIRTQLTVNQTPVNGITKTIPVGTPVDIYHKSYIGL